MCVCRCMHASPSFRILSWMPEMDCKICYFKNNTHKPDSSITVFPRVRYRLEKVDAWHNCNHNQIAIHLKYFFFFAFSLVFLWNIAILTDCRWHFFSKVGVVPQQNCFSYFLRRYKAYIFISLHLTNFRLQVLNSRRTNNLHLPAEY